MTKSFPEGTSLLDVYQEFADDIKLPYPVVSAKVNNASQGLKFRLYQNRDVCESLRRWQRLPLFQIRPRDAGQTTGRLDVQAVPLRFSDAGRRIHPMHQGA